MRRSDILRPWRVLRSRTLVSNRWITVQEDRCRTARGAIVPSYTTVTKPDFVMICAVDARGRVAIVRQYKHAAGRVVTELPAGHIDKGERPIRAAARELAEETGARAKRIVPLRAGWVSPSVLTNRGHFFLATGITQGRTAFDPYEDIQVAWLSFDQAMKRVDEVCSMAGLVLAREALPNLGRKTSNRSGRNG